MTHIKYLLNCKKFISLMILFSFFDNFGMKKTEDEVSQNGDCVDYSASGKKEKNALDFNVLLLGASGIGKTCIFRKLSNTQLDQSLLPTTGLDFLSKSFIAGDLNIILRLWNSTGVDKYINATQTLFRSTHLCVLVYSVVDKNSFEILGGLLEMFKKKNTNAQFLLVGNKIDLESERTVTTGIGEAYAKMNGMDYVEVSAATGENISFDMFVPFIRKFLEKPKKIERSSFEIIGSKNNMNERNTNSSFCDECCSCCPCLKKSEESV